MRSANPFYSAETFERAVALARQLPFGFTRWLAAKVGVLSARLSSERFEIQKKNLSPVMREGGAALDALVRRNFSRFLVTLADYCLYADSGAKGKGSPRGRRRRSTGELVSAFEGREHLDAATQSGRGVLLVTGHVGNWELGGFHLAELGLPVRVVTYPEPDDRLDAWRRSVREAWGIGTITVGDDAFALVDVIRALRDGAVVAMLIDRPPQGTAVRLPFFGREAPFGGGVELLANKSDCVVLPAFCLLDATDRYVFSALEPLRSGAGENRSQPLMSNLVRILEDVVHKHPDQWFNYVPVWSD